MNITLTLPDSMAEMLASQIAQQAEKIATGNRLVDLKEATQITRYQRRTLVAAAESKTVTHYYIAGKLHFRLADLWEWLNKSRIAAKSN